MLKIIVEIVCKSLFKNRKSKIEKKKNPNSIPIIKIFNQSFDDF